MPSLDPTQTVTLRKSYAADHKRRWRQVQQQTPALIEQARAETLTDEQAGNRFRELLLALLLVQFAGGWQRPYLRGAYLRGLTLTHRDLRGLGVPTSALDAPQDVLGRFGHVEALGALYGQAVGDTGAIERATATDAGRAMVLALAEGRDPATAVGDRIEKVGISRSKVLASTIVVSAVANATLQRLRELGITAVGAVVEMAFTTAGDNDVCPICSGLEQRDNGNGAGIFTLREAAGIIPVHPNCLHPNSLVTAVGEITSASKRWYDGEMLIIRTSTGKELTCTPNHPILTSGGWEAAGGLNVGSGIICDLGRNWEAICNNDTQNMPPAIKDVTETLFGSGEVTAVEVPLSAKDFHGDGGGSDVGIVGTKRLLGGEAYSALGDHFHKSQFIGAGELAPILFSGKRPLDTGAFRSLPPSYGTVGSRNLVNPLFRRHVCPLHFFGLTAPPDIDPIFGQSVNNDRTGNAIGLGKRVNRLSPLIAADNLFDRQLAPMWALGDAYPSASEGADNVTVSDAKLASDITGGAFGAVGVDYVTDISVIKYSGHVYNLETEHGFYTANGIITHNCRCRWRPVLLGGELPIRLPQRII